MTERVDFIIVLVIVLRCLRTDAKRLHAPPRGQVLDVCVPPDGVSDVILDAIEKSSDLSTPIAPELQYDDKLCLRVVKRQELPSVLDV